MTRLAFARSLLAIAIVSSPISAGPPLRTHPDAVETLPEWNLRRATDLLTFVERTPSHGLDPSAYGPAALRRAIAVGDPAAIDRLADSAFISLANDLAHGKFGAGEIAKRFGGLTPFDARVVMDSALLRDDVMGTLDGLAPPDLSYIKLRNALGALPADAPAAERDALIATLERRRWMSRAIKGRRIVVNIPAFRLDVYDGETLVESHRAIVGKRTTRTPQFPAAVEAVTLNPSWFVPDSIVKESVGALIRSNPAAARAKGYSWKRDTRGKLSVVQAPGVQNALGRVKLELPNAFRVYIHDTPTHELFNRPVRAFSHGCIRVAEPDALAATLLGSQGWDIGKIGQTITEGKTVTIPLTQPIPVDVVYFTAEPGPSGSILYWPDIYDLDEGMAKGLAGRTRKPTTTSALDAGCAANS